MLGRAHRLFAGNARRPPLHAGAPLHDGPRVTVNTVGLQGNYRAAADRGRRQLRSAAGTDALAADIIDGALHDRARAHDLTARVLDAARADVASGPVTPLAQREAMRRGAARLRSQRGHVLTARLLARRHAAALRALRYQSLRRSRLPLTDRRAAIVVRAAISRLGRPYVWGATGPDQFDCSGLVQWCYARAGIHLDRTTYEQINDGIPVPRSQVRPGDLVFPHAGHVQLAIGNNLVIEAPYSGASVRVSRLGNSIAIRRPL
ncbi:NLP/P60 family protein [Mycobacterium parmense]|uniref:NLP/P60 family protein n=1 Tax=Mycobacterium parmense TaxID=185642 RepID=A0A7I7Z0Z2_9MYCO|nr:NLP/P60 family protein [Mycobacterium parmense]